MQIRTGDWTSEDFGSFQDLINKIMNVEAMAIERHTGVPFETLAQSLAGGSRTAVTAFVWVLRKRQQPTLKFDEVVFSEADLELIVTDADKARFEAEQAAEAEAAAAGPQGADEATSGSPSPTGPSPDSETLSASA